MSSQTTKRLNSYPEEKIRLRVEAIESIPKTEIRVLDCFHGYGLLWTEVKKRTEKKIKVLGIEIDKEKHSPHKVIYGDNEKIIPAINLREYDLIDVDAFGDSFHLIETINKRISKGTVIIYTQISVSMGGIHKSIINKSLSWGMYKTCRSLFIKKYVEFFESALFSIGVRTVWQFNHGKKIYGYFIKS